MVIAIDGPAGAGKSSVAKGVAEALGITYLDSGAMYRCVALEALERGVEVGDPDAVGVIAEGMAISFGDGVVQVSGNDPGDAIRDPAVSAAASRVSVHRRVRDAMVERQRALIAAGDFVAEGRDIGTVVSPEAPLKVFLTASESERARRRAAESGEDPGEVLASQRDRDLRDREREHGALRVASDAIEIDTSGLTLAEVIEQVVALARERGLP